MKRVYVGIMLANFLAFSLNAMPLFSRKYQLSCNICHTVVPDLNEYGKRFQRNGNTPEEGLEVAAKSFTLENINLDLSFPLSVRVESYPFEWHRNAKIDSSTSSYDTFEIPALVVFYSSSRFSKYASGRFRLLFDKERAKNFDLDEVSFDFHPLGYESPINFRIGIQSPFYFTENPNLRLTRTSYSILSIHFPLSDTTHRLSDSKPGFFGYGFLSDIFYFDAGVYPRQNHFSKSDFYGRLGLTPIPELFISTFGYLGKTSISPNSFDKYLYYGGEVKYSDAPYHFALLLIDGQEKPPDANKRHLFGGFIEGGILRESWIGGLRYGFQTSDDYSKIKQLVPFITFNILPNLFSDIEYSASADDFKRGLLTLRIGISF